MIFVSRVINQNSHGAKLGVVAVQNLGASVRGWRISATGVVLELDAQFRVMKKLKLIGTPFKVRVVCTLQNAMARSPLFFLFRFNAIPVYDQIFLT